MEKNIFEGAKFGDKFLTRDGRVGIYAMKSYLNGKLANWVLLKDTSFTWGYDDNGILLSEIDHDLDIVSRYKEFDSITEELIRKLEYCEPIVKKYNNEKTKEYTTIISKFRRLYGL